MVDNFLINVSYFGECVKILYCSENNGIITLYSKKVANKKQKFLAPEKNKTRSKSKYSSNSNTQILLHNLLRKRKLLILNYIYNELIVKGKFLYRFFVRIVSTLKEA